MKLSDCYVGQTVEYNNAKGYNPKLKGMRAGIVSVNKDTESISIIFDDDNLFRGPFGTFPVCVDAIDVAPKITIPFDEMFGGADEV